MIINFQWITDRSQLRAEWIHFQSFKYRRRAESLEFHPKLTKEVQATLHGTQITNWYPNNHIQRGNASMRRCLSTRNLSKCQIKWSTVSPTHTHIHIRFSTIWNLPRCDRTEQCPDKTLDTVQTNLLSSFWPSSQGRSVTFGKIEWSNLPVSAESHFACHALINAGLAKLW
jgi:hypothetical protein